MAGVAVGGGVALSSQALLSRAQDKLAERAGLHHSFIGEVERGNMEISLGSLLKIAKALGVRGRDLLRDL